MRARTFPRPLLALLGPLVAATPAWAQLATASLEVTLAGPPPAGTAVRLEREGRLERQEVTDERGVARFLHLPPRRYRVARSATGETVAVTFAEAEVGPGQRWLVALPSGEARRVGADRGTPFSPESLRAVPRATDPWSVLRDVPGVVIDRVNVGGSETALQSLVAARGDAGPGVTWTLDGVDVTDPSALGSTLVFPDMDALAGLHARPGALDVRVRTPGVQVGLLLRPPAARLCGGVHLRGSADALQSDNLPEALQDRPFLRNRTQSLLEAGAEGGGALGARLWLWGAVARNVLRQDTFTEHREELRTTSIVAKARASLGAGALSLLALRSEKVHEERDTGFSAAPEARWTQSGPTHLLALEDHRRVGTLSLLARASYLHGGFALEPPGGRQADVLEDFRGVTRGSYAVFETERPRLQAGLETATARRWAGFDHELLAGVGYRRSRVSTRQAWPGNRTLALERQSVFFRAFQLTGFALPTRDQHARSVQDHVEAYLQDAARRGRLGLTLGLRLDRQAGHNRESSVEANPLVPALLPAVRYPGGPSRFRWVDLLPRAGVSWDLRGDGRWTARTGYAAYGASLGTADVVFDNPVGREPASLTFYWLDRSGDHVVQAGELDMRRGRVGSSGLDPEAPGSTVSPHVVDPGLRAPRTHALTASFEHARGPRQAGLHLSWARTLDPLWRPLRNLTLADYVIRGAAQGRLFDREYSVGYFAPASESRIVPGHGRILTNREGYRQDAVTVELTAAGRAGRRLGWSAWGAFMDWREFFTDRDRAVQDPTPLDSEPLQDAGIVAARPGGLGRGDVFVNGRWMAGATLQAELPWSLRAVAHLSTRDGFPIPYFVVASTGDPTGGAKSVLISPHLDSFRLPALVLLDARLCREFALGPGRIRALLDAFNLLNRSTTLQVARDIELPAFARPRELMRPRLVRLGLEYRF